MYVVIVGGGKVGSYLAALLLAEGHRVRIVETRREVVLSPLSRPKAGAEAREITRRSVSPQTRLRPDKGKVSRSPTANRWRR